jgi:hypothetical protein
VHPGEDNARLTPARRPADPGPVSLSDLRRLACPSCGRPHDLLVLLDRVRSALRSGPFASLGCPACGAEAQLELAPEQAAIGRVVVERGTRFEPHMRVRQPGLRVTGSPDGLMVELVHRRWVFPRRG